MQTAESELSDGDAEAVELRSKGTTANQMQSERQLQNSADDAGSPRNTASPASFSSISHAACASCAHRQNGQLRALCSTATAKAEMLHNSETSFATASSLSTCSAPEGSCGSQDCTVAVDFYRSQKIMSSYGPKTSPT